MIRCCNIGIYFVKFFVAFFVGKFLTYSMSEWSSLGFSKIISALMNILMLGSILCISTNIILCLSNTLIGLESFFGETSNMTGSVILEVLEGYRSVVVEPLIEYMLSSFYFMVLLSKFAIVTGILF